MDSKTTREASPLSERRPKARELDREGLEKALGSALPAGSARACARRLEIALYQQGAMSLEDMENESPRWRSAIEANLKLEPLLEPRGESRSAEDGSIKLLLAVKRLEGRSIEAVAIPRRDDLTLCLSSQIGCPLECAFCATGLLGWMGNLSTGEMLEQHAWAQRRAGRRVTDVVFMGMGEPLLNYDAVIQAAYALGNSRGPQISHRRIIISTAGVVPRIRQYSREGHRFPLYFSIVSAIAEKRQRLMPIEEAYPLPELVDAIREYRSAHARNRWVTIEYVAIPGENMGDEDIDALDRLFADISCIIDVIPYNATDGRFRAPTWAEVRRFVLALRRLKKPIKVRYSSGKKHGGGCGQLSAGIVAAQPLTGHQLAPAGIYSDLDRA